MLSNTCISEDRSCQIVVASCLSLMKNQVEKYKGLGILAVVLMAANLCADSAIIGRVLKGDY